MRTMGRHSSAHYSTTEAIEARPMASNEINLSNSRLVTSDYRNPPRLVQSTKDNSTTGNLLVNKQIFPGWALSAPESLNVNGYQV